MGAPRKAVKEWLEPLQAIIAYRFRNIELLAQALTHRSYAHENLETMSLDNERLEFLGDAILNAVLSHLVVDRFSDHPEGELTRIRASIVNEKALARISGRLGLGRFMRLGKGEEATGGREKASILADCYEAVLAAVYLDGGYEKTFKILEAHFSETLARLEEGIPRQNFKSLLQEETQTRCGVIPRYALEDESGPDHDKEFRVSVSVQGVTVGHGKGKTKKEAEQRAAEEALKRVMTDVK
jgi:ribonuclease-3